MKKLSALLLLCASFAIGADLDIRHIYTTNDISGTRPAVAPIRWYQGESVKWDLYVMRGTNALDFSATNLTCRMEGFLATNETTAYILKSGSIITNGHLYFDLTPEDANATDTNYVLYVKMYESVSGTNRYVGTAWKSDLQIFWGPSSTNIVYSGPYTNSSETDPIFKTFTNSPAFVIRPTVNGSNVLLVGEAAAQTNQMYVEQAGTAQVAVAAATVTGAQSNTIASALQSSDTNGWTTSSHSLLLTNGSNMTVLSVTAATGARSVFGSGVLLSGIDSAAYGASQSGYRESGGNMWIDANSYGASQHGYLEGGAPVFAMVITNSSYGSMQMGRVASGTMQIDNANGACQMGMLLGAATAINQGDGALQLFSLTGGAAALTTSGGSGSLLLGSGTCSDPNAIVAGSGMVSHGNGSITALGGFWGDGAGITNVTASNIVVNTNLNLSGYSFTNGSFIGNGSGLTNLSVAGVDITVTNYIRDMSNKTNWPAVLSAATNATFATTVTGDQSNALVGVQSTQTVVSGVATWASNTVTTLQTTQALVSGVATWTSNTVGTVQTTQTLVSGVATWSSNAVVTLQTTQDLVYGVANWSSNTVITLQTTQGLVSGVATWSSNTVVTLQGTQNTVYASSTNALLIDGTRAMTGNLNGGGKAATNFINNVHSPAIVDAGTGFVVNATLGLRQHTTVTNNVIWITLPLDSTNLTESVMMSVERGTNAINFVTNNVIWGTNSVQGIGQPGYPARTFTFMFHKPYSTTNWNANIL